MEPQTEDLVDKAIEVVLKMVRTNLQADQALKITQAFVNLTHGKNNLESLRLHKSSGTARPGKTT